jgi:hypothetical protein
MLVSLLSRVWIVDLSPLDLAKTIVPLAETTSLKCNESALSNQSLQINTNAGFAFRKNHSKLAF